MKYSESIKCQIEYVNSLQDRWRSNALEIGIGNFVIGTRLYNNDPKGEGQGIKDLADRMGNFNKHENQAWENGQTYNAPFWVGHRFGNNVQRIGYSHPIFQDRTQNFIHLRFPPPPLVISIFIRGMIISIMAFSFNQVTIILIHYGRNNKIGCIFGDVLAANIYKLSTIYQGEKTIFSSKLLS